MTEEQQIKIFGETIEQMRNAVHLTDLNDPHDVILYAMAILSDSQEEMLRGNVKTASQFVNKAKYFMAEARDLMR